MGRIHVRLDLEYKSGQSRLRRLDYPLAGFTRQWAGRVCRERREQLLNAEVLDGRAEEHRCLFPGTVGLGIERLCRSLDQLDLIIERCRHLTQKLARFGAREP